MSNFKTYRVRYCDWQTFAINVSARSAQEACELAEKIRVEIGQDAFEELDGAKDGFEAEEIETRQTVALLRGDARRLGGAS